MRNGPENRDSPELKIPKVGVAMLIFNDKGELFMIKENSFKSETGRVKDQTGIPCETSEPGESFWLTYLRGLKEEAGVHRGHVKLFDWNTVSYLGLWDFVPGVYAHVISVTCIDSERLGQSCLKNGDGEVEPVGWFKPANLVTDPNLRIGVRNILEKYINQI